MSEPIPTPRVDDKEYEPNDRSENMVVPADFARGLERETIRLKAELEVFAAICDSRGPDPCSCVVCAAWKTIAGAKEDQPKV